MEFGISTASFFTKLATEDAVSLLAKWQMPIAEVFLTSYSEYKSDFIAELNKRRGNNLDIYSVHTLGTQYEPQLFSRCERVRKDAQDLFIITLKAANALHAKYIAFHGLLALKHGTRYDIDFAASRFNEICSIAADYNVGISLENVHYTVTPSARELEPTYSLCPQLFGTLDVKQAILAGYDPIDYLDCYKGNNLSTLHLCDVSATNEPCLPYSGTYKFNKLFRELINHNLDGCGAFLEVYANSYNDFSELKECCDKLQAEYARINK